MSQIEDLHKRANDRPATVLQAVALVQGLVLEQAEAIIFFEVVNTIRSTPLFAAPLGLPLYHVSFISFLSHLILLLRLPYLKIEILRTLTVAARPTMKTKTLLD